MRPLYDMMAITLENLPSIPAVARATIGSSLILCHIISLTSVSSDAPMVSSEFILCTHQIISKLIKSGVMKFRNCVFSSSHQIIYCTACCSSLAEFYSVISWLLLPFFA